MDERDGEREPLTLQGEAAPAPEEEPRPRSAEMRAVSEGQWSLRVTIDRACKDDLETLAMMLSHTRHPSPCRCPPFTAQARFRGR